MFKDRARIKRFFSDSDVFASEDVFSCEATCGDVVAGAGACSQAQSHDIDTKARRAKTSEEEFSRFLLIIKFQCPAEPMEQREENGVYSNYPKS